VWVAMTLQMNVSTAKSRACHEDLKRFTIATPFFYRRMFAAFSPSFFQPQTAPRGRQLFRGRSAYHLWWGGQRPNLVRQLHLWLPAAACVRTVLGVGRDYQCDFDKDACHFCILFRPSRAAFGASPISPPSDKPPQMYKDGGVAPSTVPSMAPSRGGAQ
jgi:hypothetical protein